VRAKIGVKKQGERKRNTRRGTQRRVGQDGMQLWTQSTASAAEEDRRRQWTDRIKKRGNQKGKSRIKGTRVE